jgi:AcrR family transcriptional regulator
MNTTDKAVAGAAQARGRPRDPEADRAILEATMKLLMERGFSDLSIEAVAAEAGVGKTTIYRRHSGKTELVIAAMSSFKQLQHVPDTGSLRGDLIALHGYPGDTFSFRLLQGGGSTLIGTVLAEKERHPELLNAFRRQIANRRREQFRIVVERARERGEIREDVDPDYVAPMIFGSLLLRTIGGLEVSASVVEKTVDCLLNGLLRKKYRTGPQT